VTGVKQWIVFKDSDCRADGVEARAAALKDGITAIQRGFEARAVRGLFSFREDIAWHCARAPVDSNRIRVPPVGFQHCGHTFPTPAIMKRNSRRAFLF
jgi:hypothetical protein